MPIVPGDYDTPNDSEANVRRVVDDDELDARFRRDDKRIILEADRKSVRGLCDDLSRPGYFVESGRFPCRAQSWTDEQQSLFIESLIFNVPIPPLLLLSVGPRAYEVIDGRQRLQTISDYFSGSLLLSGLKLYPTLNGLTRELLPNTLRERVDRRNLSYTIVLPTVPLDDEDLRSLLRTMFDRLNTSGRR